MIAITKILLVLILLGSSEVWAATYADGGTLEGICSTPVNKTYDPITRMCGAGTDTVYPGVAGIQNASDAAAAGDTIIIRSFSGVYRGSTPTSPVFPKSGVNTSNRTKYFAYASERPVIMAVDTGNYVHFLNVVFDGATAPNLMNIVTRLDFSRLENVEIKNSGGHGILGVIHTELINMNVHDNGFRADTTFCGGYCHGGYIGSDLVDGGEWHHNRDYGLQCYPDCGIGTGGSTIRNVRMHHNGATGLFVAGGTGNVVNNVVADNNGGVGIFLAVSGAVGYNLTAYNNSGGDILVCCSGSIIVSNSIALSGIGDRDGLGFIGSNNITSGSAASLFVDAANGNFQLKPTSTVQGVGADLSSLSY